MTSTRVLGMISGTSHDGMDVAVVAFTSEADAVEARIELTTSVPYPTALRAELAAALPPAATPLDTVTRLDTRIGQAFAAAARDAIAAHTALGLGPIDVICSHGQTVFHWVEDARALGTLQIGQPAWIAEATGLPVVSDVRAADLAAGGQGAPLVPVLDRALLARFRDAGESTGALNLGGIANITVCAPGAEPLAWDIGPANALVDAVVAADPTTPDAFDRDGALAAAGTVDAALLDAFLAEPYYALPVPKSSGKELFHGAYVAAVLDATGIRPALPDLVATLTALTARTVADAIRTSRVDRVFASGGGVRNPTLMAALRDLLPDVAVGTSDDLGVPSDEKEAVAFALIGWATWHGLPGNVSSCTGATGDRVLGRITPGRDPLRMPEPRTAWPTDVRVGIGLERAAAQ